MADDLVVSMPPVTDPTGSAPRRPVWATVAAVAALAAVVAVLSVGAYILMRKRVTAPASEVGSTPTVEINGILSIKGSYNRAYQLGAACSAPSAGYGDIRAGAQVTVTGPTGEVVAVGQLQGGTVTENRQLTAEFGGGDCTWRFQVRGVPAGQGIYGIEISHRGRVQYRELELANAVLLTLG